MAQSTEAACLFETGALYGRRMLLRPEVGEPVFAGFKPGAFSVYVGDAPIYHFDLEGRWQRAYLDGLHYLKGLDGTVQTIDRVRERANLVLRRMTLNDEGAAATDARINAAAVELREALDSGRLVPAGPPPKGRELTADDLRAFVGKVVSWDAAAWSRQRDAHAAAYGALPFLPPDSPSPVVLQATLGQEGGVAFGGAAAGPFTARTPDEFRQHAEAVAALLGRRVEQAKTVFLAGPDVLRRPPGDVAAFLEAAARIFPIEVATGPRHPDPTGETPHRLDGVHAFLDRLDGPLPSPADWRRFHGLGLTRVCLGVGSGAPAVRGRLSRGWSNDALAATVADLKAAGIGVGVAVLVGVGGEELMAEHVQATAAVVNALPLGPGDLVSLLDAREFTRARASTDSASASVTQAAFEAEREALRSRLAPVRAERRAKVVPYSLEKQGSG